MAGTSQQRLSDGAAMGKPAKHPYRSIRVAATATDSSSLRARFAA
jgi:hypothetical protein